MLDIWKELKILPLYVMNNEISGNGVTLSRLEGTDNIKLYNSMFGINYTNFEIKTSNRSF